ncbi:MAG TPA: SpoIIE family protein phosphatase [Bacteroidales bacterium]|jgi:serine phosphatase RsbU (regulator of sigma subunit)|nr:SpoIIE family protein phosphatase [Bacteroidales bacterium]
MKGYNTSETSSATRHNGKENEISESLRYASYIQQAIFPSQKLINRLLPENFVFYRPRDVISGDFYYATQKNEKLIVGVGDCTGHGVPGALMSILGITFLNEIIARGIFSSAGSILNQMREHVMDALCQTGEENERKDGIDLALCVIDPKTHILSFSGAFNPVYIVRDNALVEIAGDMMPVGVGADEELCFTTHLYELNPNDAIYLFTDGFADQFGGPENRKFKYKPFRDLLREISSLPMHKQKMAIDSTFNDWKGNLRQLDDVLVFGFRYSTLG